MHKKHFGAVLGALALSLLAAILTPSSIAGPAAGLHPACDRTSDAALTSGLKAHLEHLTSPEMEGRKTGTPGYRLAAAYAEKVFRSLGLEPGWTMSDGRRSFFQPVPSKGQAIPDSFNVIALLRGSDPAHGGEFITLGAHLDHLGKVGGTIYPGANDDASGCAAVLEAARVVAGSPSKRPIIFVLFAGEEMGLIGSQEFVRNPPVPLDEVVININVEQIGSRHRDFPGLIAMGPLSQKPAFEAAARRVPKIKVRFEDVKKYLDVVRGSDTWSFVLDRRPAIILGSGGFREHHRPEDTVALIDYDQMTLATSLVIAYVMEAADR